MWNHFLPSDANILGDKRLDLYAMIPSTGSTTVRYVIGGIGDGFSRI